MLTVKMNELSIRGLISVASFGAGVGATYFALNKRLELKYSKIAEEEISQARSFYSRLNKKDEYSSPEKVLELVTEEKASFAADLGYGSPRITPLPVGYRTLYDETEEDANEDEEDDDPDEWNYAREEKNRLDPEKPYILHHDEFFEGEKDYQQVSLTYYGEDDILLDDKDVPLSEIDRTVGQDNLARFGYGSKDKKIVYIRNDRLALDFEVVYNEGDYAQEVLGFIKHSEHRGPRKFRSDNE